MGKIDMKYFYALTFLAFLCLIIFGSLAIKTKNDLRDCQFLVVDVTNTFGEAIKGLREHYNVTDKEFEEIMIRYYVDKDIEEMKDVWFNNGQGQPYEDASSVEEEQ
jgi:hypothetical protein